MKNLLFLNKYLIKYKSLLIIGTIFILIANIFALYPAEFVRHAFDNIESIISKNSTKNTRNFVLLKYGGLIIVFAIMKGTFMYFMRQTIIVMSRKIEFDLKSTIYKQYQKLSLSFYKKNNTGDLMNRITEDVNRVRMYLGPALMYAINMLFLFTLVISKMISINTTLTMYVLAPLPILAIAIYFVSNQINRKSEIVQRQLSTITSVTQEDFSAISIIKSFNNRKKSIKLFTQECKDYTKKQLKLVSIEACFFPLIILLIGISTITTIYIGGLETFKGKITTGNIAEFIIYINMLTWPVASVGWITSIVQRAEASMKRINEFLDNDEKIKNTGIKKKYIDFPISFKNISFTYKDTKIKALEKINFKLERNKSLGIFGKTGSGKSTIANLICRLYENDSGNIKFGSSNIKDLNLSTLRRNIGYVPQDGYLFSGTVEENISFGREKCSIDEIKEICKITEISNEIENFENKYKTIIGERGVQLSGGQRQRISIARALIINPSIYIFDDCLSAIDANKEEKILNNIDSYTKESTRIIISHRTSSLKNTDHIIVLEKGKIIEEGTHNELIKTNGFYAKMHKEQTKKVINK